jgi:hypothetical protein
VVCPAFLHLMINSTMSDIAVVQIVLEGLSAIHTA